MVYWKEKRDVLTAAQRHFFSKQLHVNPFIVSYLAKNGHTSLSMMQHVLFQSLKIQHNPLLLQDMSHSIIRILKSVKNIEKIVIFGDYDVDGITSTALLYKALKRLGADVVAIVPLRSEGYGMQQKTVQDIIQRHKPALIITVDNGSSSHDAIKLAKSKGVDVIVTDHHDILQGNPGAYSFINPKRADNLSYPFRELAGVGVAYKLVQGIFEALGLPWNRYKWDYVDLACIGTVADMVPLQNENRAIVADGLQKINQEPSPFFQLLSEQLNLSSINSRDIGYKIAPILNASGRVGDPNTAVSILTTNHPKKEEVEALISLNKHRKQLTREQLNAAHALILKNNWANSPILITKGPFSDGIIGILASQLAHHYQKPTIVLTEEGKGSCRTAPNTSLSIINIVERGKEFVTRYGGHQAAAGLSISPENIESFRSAVQAASLSDIHQEAVVEYHATLPIHSLSKEFIEDLSLLEPFGLGNPNPLFHSPLTTVSNIDHFGPSNMYFNCTLNDQKTICFSQPEKGKALTSGETVNCLYQVDAQDRYIMEDFTPIAQRKPLAVGI